MNNLARFEQDGIELMIDTVTGESFASKRGYARMAGIDESTVRKRIKGADYFGAKSAKVPTPGGLQGADLIDESTICNWLMKDNPEMAIQLMKMGVRAFLHQLAGYKVTSNAIADSNSNLVNQSEEIALLREQNELLKTQCSDIKTATNTIVENVVLITKKKVGDLKNRVEGFDRTMGQIQQCLTEQKQSFELMKISNQYQEEMVLKTFKILDEIQSKIASQGDINQFIPEKAADAFREKIDQINHENAMKFKKIRERNEMKKADDGKFDNILRRIDPSAN